MYKARSDDGVDMTQTNQLLFGIHLGYSKFYGGFRR